MQGFCSFVRTVTLIAAGSALGAVLAVADTQDKMPITTSSESALEYYVEGRELIENLRTQDARSSFERAVEADPDFAVAHLQLAGTQPSPNAFFKSLQRAQALMDKVSEAERIWILGFTAGAVDGDPMGQRELYQRLVDTYPDDERARSLLAANYFGQQEWSLAIEEYDRAAQVNADFAPIYNQMGYALRFLKRYEDAEKAFKKYQELIPNDANPLDSYAELLMKMGRFDESIQKYEEALAINPTFVFSHVGIASNLVLKGQHEAARAQLQVMYDNAQNDGQQRAALSAMAFAYMDEGDYDKAMEKYGQQYALAEAIEDPSAMSGVLSLMGFALVEVEERAAEALQKFEESTAMVQEASSLSEEVKSQNRLGHLFNASRAYLAMGDLKQAQTNADEYGTRADAGRNPGQIKAAHQLFGLIAASRGQFNLAIKEFRLGNLQSPYVLFHLARAYEGAGNEASARKYYEEVANFNGLNSSPAAAVRVRAVKKAAAM